MKAISGETMVWIYVLERAFPAAERAGSNLITKYTRIHRVILPIKTSILRLDMKRYGAQPGQ
jgi:hypothetical protein